jgi:nitroreductase
MNFDDIIKNRRSVRAFDDTPVAHDDIVAICEAARLAPSACNSQTWRFVAVTDRDLLDRICKDAMRPVISNKWLKQAPLIIVGCSKLDLVANRLGSGITGIEYYQIDLGIAMEHIVLKATELGLGTCWIGWFKKDKIKEILNIPKNVKVSALLAVGHPTNEDPKKRSRNPIEKFLSFNKWGKTQK